MNTYPQGSVFEEIQRRFSFIQKSKKEKTNNERQEHDEQAERRNEGF